MTTSAGTGISAGDARRGIVVPTQATRSRRMHIACDEVLSYGRLDGSHPP
jgi:hypothetical protein